MDKRLLVIGEIKDHALRNVTCEAIAAAKEIDPNGHVIGVLCGSTDLRDHAQDMIYHGADEVFVIEHRHLENYTSEGFGQAIMQVIHEKSPQTIVMGHTAMGKDLMPKIASKLDAGLISDVTHIELQADQAVFTRPIYSGKAFEKKIINDGTVLATIRPNNIAQFPKDVLREGKVIKKDIDIVDLQTIIKQVVRKTSMGVDMSEANVVIAGGRGVKSADGFKSLYELAELLGGAVGASRGACDANYCDYSLQIGQTGKIVTPDLYIAVGISGAIQHVAGMSHSKIIVAINKDPDATIFSIADYGIVGDLFEVLPLLIEEIKKVKVLRK